MTVSLDFSKQYHAIIVKALGEDAKKINSKIGQIIVNDWLNNVGALNDNIEFAQSFENYLGQLGFAQHVKVYCNKKDYTLDIKGCIICHGNEILRKENIPTMCPIIQAAKYAALKKLGRNVTTKGVEKSGIIGECIIRFELESSLEEIQAK